MLLELAMVAFITLSSPAQAIDPTGAWQHVRDDGTTGTWIMTDEHFAIARYRSDPPSFVSTEGGTWSLTESGLRLTYEFDTSNTDLVGTARTIPVQLSQGAMTVDSVEWTRIDDGAPGALEGSWLITGRKRDGEISTRRPGARRTMKILSGTRFQWIAYNVETKEFFGTGGGTYTTHDGTYVESIEFFSRDESRVGMNLEFSYALRDGEWHHSGKSSKGDPMYEVWTRRKDLGI